MALANGSSNTAGKEAHLVIGPDEQLTLDGDRVIHDVGELLPDRKQIQKIISAACKPEIENIEIDVIPVDNKRVVVFTIPPSPYLYETTRELNCTRGKFNEHVVFIRRGETIGIASAEERSAVFQLKQIRFSELKNVPPVKFGAIVGALIGGPLLLSIGDKVFGNSLGRAVGFFLGTIVFAGFGAMIGNLYKEIIRLRNIWERISSLGQILIILTLIAIAIYWLTMIWTQIVG